jgi:epoxyqueuosine reductase
MAHESFLQGLKRDIRQWGGELGFTALGFAPASTGGAERHLADWLAAGYHGGMDYMARHGDQRARPDRLLPGTRSVICVRLDYFPAAAPAATNPVGEAAAAGRDLACISRYAWGRDYHKLMRSRLQRLAERIQAAAAPAVGPVACRAFADSAPVMEVELARLAGLGWRGKHTLLLARQGSWFFLGELYTDLELPPDDPAAEHCGSCTACLASCPTEAFVAPYVLDARRCISYLTIEHHGPIPEALRPLLGNRVYGCDDCQAACPWNRFARPAALPDFLPRHGLDAARLVDLFAWTETQFNDRLAGSPIRRIGHQRWLRNLAVGLGNAPPEGAVCEALATRREHPSPLVREHVDWALRRQGR